MNIPYSVYLPSYNSTHMRVQKTCTSTVTAGKYYECGKGGSSRTFWPERHQTALSGFVIFLHTSSSISLESSLVADPDPHWNPYFNSLSTATTAGTDTSVVFAPVDTHNGEEYRVLHFVSCLLLCPLIAYTGIPILECL